MQVRDLKWYSPLVFFVGAILSFADPITDILTLVKFYRADHKTWFGVGLTFVLLPCLVFPVLFFHLRRDDDDAPSLRYAKTALCAFHPFSAAFARIEAFIFSIKKLRFGLNAIDEAKAEYVLNHIAAVVLFEAVLESAPQFIIQLYAISVQEEPAAIIQMISLPVSFFTLAWAFTATDERTLVELKTISNSSDLKVKHKVALYVTHLLLLSSRLLAICYYTVSYNWWVVVVLSLHSCVVVVVIFFLQRGEPITRNKIQRMFVTGFFMGVHCLRDDASVFFIEEVQVPKVKGVSVIVLLSHWLFVGENYHMILEFLYTYHFNTWYSLLVTLCVCVFSVLGSMMRICLLCRLRE